MNTITTSRKIIFLVSGNGGTLKSLYYATQRLRWNINISLVVADRPCGAIDFAHSHSIRTAICDYKAENDQSLFDLLKQESADLVITNIHRIITPRILDLFPDQFINLHYSLLPSFAGLVGMATLEQAKQQNVKWIGATTHCVNEQLDQGRIIGQSILPVDWKTDDDKILSDLVFRGACLIFLQSISELLGMASASKPLSTLTICNHELFFNPPIEFEAKSLDEEYWNCLKQ